MKKLLISLPIMILCSCEWVLTHPKEDLSGPKHCKKEFGKFSYQFEDKQPLPPPCLGVENP
jgi:hypothetical protein